MKNQVMASEQLGAPVRYFCAAPSKRLIQHLDILHLFIKQMERAVMSNNSRAACKSRICVRCHPVCRVLSTWMNSPVDCWDIKITSENLTGEIFDLWRNTGRRNAAEYVHCTCSNIPRSNCFEIRHSCVLRLQQ